MFTKGGHNNNKNVKAFTLVEMLIVLLIMGILLMMTMGFSGYQIQKLESKSVKESILAEWQNHYARNLGSSSYAGMIYRTMTVQLKTGSNQISFIYSGGESSLSGNFSNKFIIKNILTNPDDTPDSGKTSSINIMYTPYKMYCERGEDDDNNSEKLAIVTTINSAEDYCFEINKKNCRLVEVECNSTRIDN